MRGAYLPEELREESEEGRIEGQTEGMGGGRDRLKKGRTEEGWEEWEERGTDRCSLSRTD